MGTEEEMKEERKGWFMPGGKNILEEEDDLLRTRCRRRGKYRVCRLGEGVANSISFVEKRPDSWVLQPDPR